MRVGAAYAKGVDTDSLESVGREGLGLGDHLDSAIGPRN